MKRAKSGTRGWICISKVGNLRFMRRAGVYGVGKKDIVHLKSVRPGDDLFVFTPGTAHKVVARCRVESRMYESREPDAYRWPFRIKLRFLWDVGEELGRGVVLPWTIGSNVYVEPHFRFQPIYQLTPGARSALLDEIEQAEST